jgi:hypothetical protein
MKKIILIAAILVAAYFGLAGNSRVPTGNLPVHDSTVASDKVLASLFSERKSSIQVQGAGVVTKLLPDDNDGNRHQRFIVRLASGQTLLIAHNIDQAARIEGLKPGDRVEFNGEYEWNHQGGVIHWTHRDPAGRHLPGWIRHKGRTYG